MTEPTVITQQDVLAALMHLKGGGTTEDLAGRLHASERAVRRHLAALHEEKKVVRTFFYTGDPPVGRYRYVCAAPKARG